MLSAYRLNIGQVRRNRRITDSPAFGARAPFLDAPADDSLQWGKGCVEKPFSPSACGWVTIAVKLHLSFTGLIGGELAMPRPVCFFALCAVLVTSAAPASSVPALDGFGAFKFGMSPGQARAVPGQIFGAFSAKNLLEENIGSMASKKPAMVYGASYSFDLFFNSFQALRKVSLQNQKTSARADCENTFLALLSQLEKTYGKLSPVYPQRKKDDQAQVPISVEWKSSAGASRYQLATVYLAQE